MFRCGLCDKVVSPNVPRNTMVTQTRQKDYYNEFYVEDEKGNKKLQKVTSVGYETVTELHLCPDCAERSEEP